jgi:hypothetical protein
MFLNIVMLAVLPLCGDRVSVVLSARIEYASLFTQAELCDVRLY